MTLFYSPSFFVGCFLVSMIYVVFFSLRVFPALSWSCSLRQEISPSPNCRMKAPLCPPFDFLIKVKSRKGEKKTSKARGGEWSQHHVGSLQLEPSVWRWWMPTTSPKHPTPPLRPGKSLTRHKVGACSGATPFLAHDERRIRLRRISVHSLTSTTLPLPLQVYDSRTDDD